MDAETGFMIDGKVYEVPTLDSLTMGELRLLFELSGLTQEDFVREEDESDEDHDARVGKLMRHPGFMEALMHVAYQRGNPTTKRQKVALVIEGTNYLEAVSAIVDEEDEPEEEAVPLALTTEPEQSSLSGSVENESSTERSNESGGSDSMTDSAEPGELPTPIGTLRSATSSPESPPGTSAASGQQT